MRIVHLVGRMGRGDQRPYVDGLDTPKAIIRGSYIEVMAFEIAYHRAAKSSPLKVDGSTALEA